MHHPHGRPPQKKRRKNVEKTQKKRRKKRRKNVEKTRTIPTDETDSPQPIHRRIDIDRTLNFSMNVL